MVLSGLHEQNPWWINKKKIESDPLVQAWDNSKVKWDPPLRQTFEDGDYIYSLRGSRQTGKTTLVKLEIRQKLKLVPKWNIMYYSFDLEYSPYDVFNILHDYFEDIPHDEVKQHFIYLDEISNIKDWQKAIKKLKDLGKLNKCTIVAIGSHSIDLRHAAELLSGRRGFPANSTLDKTLRSMSFGEFSCAIDKEIKEITSQHLPSTTDSIIMIRDMLNGVMNDDLKELLSFQNKLNTCLKKYLMTGGIPKVTNEFLNEGYIKEITYQSYIDMIIGDLKRNKRDISHIKQIIRNTIDTITTSTSWRSLQKNSDTSDHTVQDYIKTLEDLFILSVFYKYDSKNNSPKFDGLRKIYFNDPFFLHAFNGYSLQKESYKLSLELLDNPESYSKIVEQTVADHCVRLAYNLTTKKSGFLQDLNVFYWKSKKSSREVDFVIKDNDSLIPIETKYQNQIKRDDLYGIIDFKKATGVNRGIILTKDQFAIKDNAVLIPTCLFLLLV